VQKTASGLTGRIGLAVPQLARAAHHVRGLWRPKHGQVDSLAMVARRRTRNVVSSVLSTVNGPIGVPDLNAQQAAVEAPKLATGKFFKRPLREVKNAVAMAQRLERVMRLLALRSASSQTGTLGVLAARSVEVASTTGPDGSSSRGPTALLSATRLLRR